MCSTALLTYLDCIKHWVHAPDEHVRSLISEFQAFVLLGDYDPDPVIEEKFTELVRLANMMRNETTEADVTQFGSDATAADMLWNFGFGMIAFGGYEAMELMMPINISSKSEKLNVELKTLDITLASKLSSDVTLYIEKYQENNILIFENAAKDMDKRQCRANIHQFMAALYNKKGYIDVATFRKYAQAAETLYNYPKTAAFFGTLDDVLVSDKNEEDKAKDTFNYLHKFLIDMKPKKEDAFFVTDCVLHKMLSSGISKECLKLGTQTLRLPSEVIDAAIGIPESVGEFAAAVTVAFSVVDSIRVIFSSADVVEQCKKECAELEGPIKQHYKDFFNGIRESSKKLGKAPHLK